MDALKVGQRARFVGCEECPPHPHCVCAEFIGIAGLLVELSGAVATLQSKDGRKHRFTLAYLRSTRRVR